MDIIRTCCIFSIISVVLFSPAQAGNLAVNGDFETGVTSFPGWHYLANPTIINTDSAPGGSYCLQNIATGTPSTQFAIQGNFAASPGQKYLVSFNSKLISGTGTHGASDSIAWFRCINSAFDAVLGGEVYYFTYTEEDTWENHSLPMVTCPEGTAYWDFYFLMNWHGGSSVGLTERFDNVVVVLYVPFDDSSFTDTPLRTQLGTALQEIYDGGGNALTTELLLLTGSDRQAAYDQLSGSNIPSTHIATNTAVHKFMSTVSNRMRSTSPLQAALFPNGPFLADAGQDLAAGHGTDVFADQPWGIWVKGFQAFGDREKEGTSSGYQYESLGTAFGFDYKFTPELLLGATFGMADTYLDVFASRDGTTITSTYAGVYGSYEVPEWYFDASVVYGWSEYDNRRYVNVGSILEQAKAKYDGDQIAGYFEGGLNFYRSNWILQPMAAFEFSHEKQESFNETGTTSSNLHVGDSSFNSYKGSLGAKFTTPLFSDTSGVKLLAELRGRWEHEYGDTSASATSNFIGYSNSFKVEDEGVDRDSAIVGARLTARVSKHLELMVDYDTTINRDFSLHVFSAGLECRW